jgi:hypothetical protein
MPLRKDGLNYFHLKDTLMNLENTEKSELEKTLKALGLSKVIYEKKGIDKGVRITGRAIGGINRYLKLDRQ